MLHGELDNLCRNIPIDILYLALLDAEKIYQEIRTCCIDRLDSTKNGRTLTGHTIGKSKKWLIRDTTR